MTPEHNRKATESQLSLMPTASIEAGLAAAFQRSGDANSSVLQSIHKDIGPVPSVILRPPTSFDHAPVLQTQSAEMPSSESHPRYRVDGQIAKGGMGAILQGRDKDLGRDLAIKVLLDSHKDKPAVIQRFIEEAQIGGQLQHPGIVPVYELGQFEDKRPFFTMKLVKGKTLAALLEARQNAADERAKFIGIFEQVCQTMAYAHSRAVIHRDLKPANIMVGAFGEVQVMDWGLAKVLSTGGVADEEKACETQQDRSIIETLRSAGSNTPTGLGSQTQMGSVMGTPAYMPPEQALGEIDQLDERADVFGLGSILCEILTGKPPYVAENSVQVFRLATRAKLDDCFQRLDECGAASELVSLAKQCLAAEPTDRPRDAEMLADRISTYQEAVEMRLRDAEIGHAAQTVRAEEESKRRRVSLALATALLALVIAIGGGGFWIQVRETIAAENEAQKNEQLAVAANNLANEEKERAELESQAKEKLRWVLYQSDLQRAQAEIEAGNYEDGQGILSTHIAKADEPDLRGFEWYYLNRLCPLPTATSLFQWDDGLPEQLHQQWHHVERAISRDGSHFAAVVDAADSENKRLAVWNTTSGKVVWSTEIDFPVDRPQVKLSDDGQFVGVGSVGFVYRTTEIEIPTELHIWDVKKKEKLARITQQELSNFAHPAVEFEFRPNSHEVAVTTVTAEYEFGTRLNSLRSLVMWDFAAGTRQFERVVQKKPTRGTVKFSPDGSMCVILMRRNHQNFDRLATSWSDAVSIARIVDAETGETLRDLHSMSYYFGDKCEFSPDSKRLAIAAKGFAAAANREYSQHGALLIWDIDTGALVSTAPTKAGMGYVKFSPSGEYLVTLPQSQADTPEVYRTVDGSPLLRVENPHGGIVHFSKDERYLQTLDRNGKLWKWKLPISDFQVNTSYEEPGQYVKLGFTALSGDGKQLVRIPRMVSRDRRDVAQLFDIDGNLIRFLEMPWTDVGHQDYQLNHDGSLLARVHNSKSQPEVSVLSLWDHEQDKVNALFHSRPEEELKRWKLSPTDATAAGIVSSSTEDATAPLMHQLRIWDQGSLQQRAAVDLSGEVTAFSFTEDGTKIAIFARSGGGQASREEVGTLTLYDSQTGTVSQTLSIPGTLTSIVVSANGRLLAGNNVTSSQPQQAHTEIWNLETGQRVAVIEESDLWMTFSPAGNRLITRRGEQFTIWDTSTGTALLRRTYSDNGGRNQLVFRFLPGEDRLVGIAAGGAPAFWDGTPVE